MPEHWIGDIPDGGGVYLIRHTPSGRVYVGSTQDFRHRWTDHRNALFTQKHQNKPLQAAFNADGADSLRWCLAESVADMVSLWRREEHWITALRAREPQFGFNVRLSVAEVIAILHAAADRVPVKILAQRHRQSATNIGRIIRRTIWSDVHIPDDVVARLPDLQSEYLTARKTGEHLGPARLTVEQVKEIRQRCANGERRCKIAAEYNVTPGLISAIHVRRVWKHIA